MNPTYEKSLSVVPYLHTFLIQTIQTMLAQYFQNSKLHFLVWIIYNYLIKIFQHFGLKTLECGLKIAICSSPV